MSRGRFTYDDGTMSQVSNIKRFLELVTMDSDFGAPLYPAYAEKIGVGTDDLKYLYDRDFVEANINPPVPVQNYRRFIKDKLEMREDFQKKGCVPNHPVFKKWRERQVNRCWVQLGARNMTMIHTPILFELCKGCSIGCGFCGLNAGKLSSVFIYNDQTKALWRDVLISARDIIGEAASAAVCYYATEPFDNPDYEKFSDIFTDIFDCVPQITTAAAMRNPERTKRFLLRHRDNSSTVHRFSVLSLSDLHKIHDYFTPEELFLVELLPQFAQAPGNAFTKAGRLYTEAGSQDNGTICCLSGFIVNMAEQTIRLASPTISDDEHPTGEILFGGESFNSCQDFTEKLQKMINQYMKPTADYARLGFDGTLRYEKLAQGFQLASAANSSVKFLGYQDQPYDVFGFLGEMLRTGGCTADEAARELYEYNDIPPELTYYAFSNLYDCGVLS